MEVTYKNLCDGYTLKPEDTLTIHGCTYDVAAGCFLNYIGTYCNDRIFEVLGIDKVETCKRYGMEKPGMFPYMRSLQCLTNLVKALYEMSPFKVGDRVKISKRLGEQKEYPYDFTDEMAALKGEVFTIAKIESTQVHNSRKYSNGDPNQYLLEGTRFLWHSSMFERVSQDDKVNQEQGDNTPKEKQKEQYQLSPNYNRRTAKTHIIL